MLPKRLFMPRSQSLSAAEIPYLYHYRLRKRLQTNDLQKKRPFKVPSETFPFEWNVWIETIRNSFVAKFRRGYDRAHGIAFESQSRLRRDCVSMQIDDLAIPDCVRSDRDENAIQDSINIRSSIFTTVVRYNLLPIQLIQIHDA